MKEEKKVIKGYKGFDKDLKCRGFQYEVGKEYECDKAIACEKGFHFCERPLDVFKFYPPLDDLNRYCEVEGSGDFDRDNSDDKVCCTKIKIIRELTLQELIEEETKELGDNVDKISEKKKSSCMVYNDEPCSLSFNHDVESVAINTGNGSMARNIGMGSVALSAGNNSIASNSGAFALAENTGAFSASVSSSGFSISDTTGDFSLSANMGNSSLASNEGNESVAVNMGDGARASTEGINSIAFVTGENSKAKGALGCWIVLTERDCQTVDNSLVKKINVSPIKDIKAFKVDGETIKPYTYYKLVDGKPVEVLEK